MDKIQYRNPSKSEVIGRCGGDEKRMTTKNGQKSNAKKKINLPQLILQFTLLYKTTLNARAYQFIAEAPLCLGSMEGWYMIDSCLGCVITSMGINCEQKGITLSSAPRALYSATTSGIATFFSCQRLYLYTGIPSASAATAGEKKHR